MTQIANVLAVDTVFVGLWSLLSTFDSQRRRRFICRNFCQKCRGLMCERRRNCGIFHFRSTESSNSCRAVGESVIDDKWSAQVGEPSQ